MDGNDTQVDGNHTKAWDNRTAGERLCETFKLLSIIVRMVIAGQLFGENVRRDLLSLAKTDKMWRLATLPELFRRRKLGSKSQAERLLEVSNAEGGKYKRDWKCLIFNGRRSSWQKKSKKGDRRNWVKGRYYEWYNDEEIRVLLRTLDVSTVEEIRVYGCGSDGETDMPDGAAQLFLELLKRMPNLKEMDLAHNDFSAFCQAKVLLTVPIRTNLRAAIFAKWKGYDFGPDSSDKGGLIPAPKAVWLKGRPIGHLLGEGAFCVNKVKECVLVVETPEDLEQFNGNLDFFKRLKTVTMVMKANLNYPRISKPRKLEHAELTVFAMTWRRIGNARLVSWLSFPEGGWPKLKTLRLRVVPPRSGGLHTGLDFGKLWRELGSLLNDQKRFPALKEVDVMLDADVHHWIDWYEPPESKYLEMVIKEDKTTRITMLSRTVEIIFGGLSQSERVSIAIWNSAMGWMYPQYFG